MAKKELSCNYHKFTSRFEIIKKVEKFFNNLNKNRDTESIKNYKFYIFDDYVTNNDYICFTLAKVDTEETPQLDNVETQQRRPIEKDDDEGLAKDAQFLYHYKTNIIIQRKGKGIATIKELQEFLALKIKSALSDINIDLILQKDTMQRIDEIEIFEKFTFRVAVPQQISLLPLVAPEESDIKKVIDFAKSISATDMRFEFQSKKLSKNRILEAWTALKKQKEYDNIEIKSLSIEGEGEILDLVKGKLGYLAKWEYHGSEITNKDIYQFLIEAYNKNLKYLEAYVNE